MRFSEKRKNLPDIPIPGFGDTPDDLRVSALREQALCASGGGFAPGGRYL